MTGSAGPLSLSQIEAQVLAVLDRASEARVIAIQARTQAAWPDTINLSGRPFRLRWCASPLMAREALSALFPGYVSQLHGASFLSAALDDALEWRESGLADPVATHMLTDKVWVAPDFADIQVAEIFHHHPVQIVPVVDGADVHGVILRQDFFRAMAARVLERAQDLFR